MAESDDQGYESDGQDFVPTLGLLLYEGCNKRELDEIMELMSHYKLIRFPCYLFRDRHRRHLKFRLYRVISRAFKVKSSPLIALRHFTNIVLEERDQVMRFASKFFVFENPSFYYWFCDFKSQFDFINHNDSDVKYFDTIKKCISHLPNEIYPKFCVSMVILDKILYKLTNWYEARFFDKFEFQTWYFKDVFEYKIHDCDEEIDPGLYLPIDDDYVDTDDEFN